MKWLIDTNVLLRLVEITALQHLEAKNAVDKLLKKGDTLYVLLQNISEFWNVCTRPLDKNGLGFSIAQTEVELSKIEQVFDILPDTTEVYKNWRELVVKHSISGVKFHDAKIAAALESAQHRKSADLQRQRFQTLSRHQSRRTERCLEFQASPEYE